MIIRNFNNPKNCFQAILIACFLKSTFAQEGTCTKTDDCPISPELLVEHSEAEISPKDEAETTTGVAVFEVQTQSPEAYERERRQLRDRILTGRNEMYMQVWESPSCGRFVRTLIPYETGDLVAEYVGDIFTNATEVDQLAVAHNHSNHMGYIFKMEFDGKQYWLDPDSEVVYGNRMARLFSHGIDKVNMHSRVIADDQGFPHVILVAIKDIAIGDELRYNYGVSVDQIKPEDQWMSNPAVADAEPVDAVLVRVALAEAFPNFPFDGNN